MKPTRPSTSAHPLTAPRRCAVYCRVSSDERLDQAFNSIDAQRDAGQAYILSQRQEGWISVPDGYEDPGYSGGHMDRPALQRLLTDIEAGKVDVVVVYKIDRLSRSLADFARMVDVFDRHGVSFVSVTQQFSTTSSMGRLTLNILLSFAQFEREVTGERIRDKFAASKAKGMWMGGVVPLGYRVENRCLVVEPQEARAVRSIFEKFAELQSVTDVVRWLKSQGITTRRGHPFSKQGLWKLLNNRIYCGEISHKVKGTVAPGQHDAIIEPALWDTVQAVHARPCEERPRPLRRKPPFLLAGLVVTEDGDRLQPSFTSKPGGKCYRYYVPGRIQSFGESSPLGRLQADPLEQMVLAQVQQALKTPEMMGQVWEAAQESGTDLTETELLWPLLRNFAQVWEALYPLEQQRIVRLLIRQVVVGLESVAITWHEAGWLALGRELRPGSLVAELKEAQAA